MTKKKTFLTRGEEAQREREESLKEYSKAEHIHHRELEEIGRNLRRAEAAGDIHAVSEYSAVKESLLADIATLAAPRLETTEKMYRRGVRTALGGRATKEDVARYQYSTANYGAASSLAHRSSTSELQEQISAAQAQRYSLNQEILSEAHKLSAAGSTPLEKQEAKSSLSTKWQTLEALAQQEGIAKAGLSIQKRKGIDTSSLYESTADIMGRQIKQSWINDVKTGAAGSGSAINKSFDEALAKLTRSFGDLDEAMHRAVATEDEIAKQKRDIAEAEKKVKDDKAAFDKANIQKETFGGMSGRGGWGTPAAWGLGIIGSGVMAEAAIARQWRNQRDQDTTRLQTGFMGIANQRYQDAQDAAGGDMAAILRAQRDALRKEASYANKLSKKETRFSQVEAGGMAAGAGEGALIGGAQGMLLGGPAAAIAGAVGSASTGVAQTSGRMAQLNSGAIGAESFIENANAARGLTDAQLFMNARVQGRALDITRQTWAGTAGAGAGRSDILKAIREVGFQQDLVDKYGISQEMMTGLTNTGIRGLGKQFRTSDIAISGKFAASGLGSADEYMGLRSQIQSTGGTRDNLETILRNAVAAGMDSSKNIAEMTSTMSHMAAYTSAGGVSTFGGAAAGVASSIEMLRASGVTEAMAPGAARLAGDQISASLNRRQIDLPSLVQSARMHKEFGLGPGTLEGEAAAKMKPEQIRSLRQILDDPRKTEAEKQKAINEHGQGLWLKASDKDASDKLKKLSDFNLEKAASDATSGYLYANDPDRLVSRSFTNPDSLTKEQKERAGAIFSAAKMAGRGAAEKIEAYLGYGSDRKAKEGLYKVGEDVGLEADKAGAQAGVTQYAAGLQQINNNFSEILKTMHSEARNLDPEKFKEIVEASAGHLDKSVAALAATIDRLNIKLGGTAPSATSPNPTAANIKNNADPRLGSKVYKTVPMIEVD